MPNVSPDQGLTYPADPDSADNPVAFANFIAGVENRLNRRYTNLADRTARDLAPAENQVTALAAEDRFDAYDGANYISLFTRSLFAQSRVAADQTISNTLVLTNVTNMAAALPTAGIFQFRAELFYDSSTTEDIALAFTWPAAATARWGGAGMVDVGVAAGVGSLKVTTAAASGTSISYGGGGVGTIISGALFGEITMGGTAGNLQLQFAQNAAAATNTSIRARTRLQVWRVA